MGGQDESRRVSVPVFARNRSAGLWPQFTYWITRLVVSISATSNVTYFSGSDTAPISVFNLHTATGGKVEYRDRRRVRSRKVRDVAGCGNRHNQAGNPVCELWPQSRASVSSKNGNAYAPGLVLSTHRIISRRDL